MITIILAVVLGLAGLTAVAVASLLILRPLWSPLGAAVERARLQRCVARRDRGDGRLAADDVPGALREFGGAFCFLVPRAEPGLIVEIARLHTGLLSRFISIGDNLPGAHVQLFSLAKVERLLEQWMETQRRALRRTPTARDMSELQQHRRAAEQAIRELVGDLLERQGRPVTH